MFCEVVCEVGVEYGCLLVVGCGVGWVVEYVVFECVVCDFCVGELDICCVDVDIWMEFCVGVVEVVFEEECRVLLVCVVKCIEF